MSRRRAFLHPLTGFLLALALVIAACAQSAMAGRMIGLTAVEICADATGVATILLDRQGNPEAPAPDCPLCLATHPALSPQPDEPFRLPQTAATTARWSLAARPALPPAPQSHPPARAPPPLA
jgi:hypothetical protein